MVLPDSIGDAAPRQWIPGVCEPACECSAASGFGLIGCDFKASVEIGHRHESSGWHQFARSFRSGEQGRLHDVEFVLVEWYAPATTLADTAPLLERICHATLGTTGIDATYGRGLINLDKATIPQLKLNIKASLPRLTAAHYDAVHGGMPEPVAEPIDQPRQIARSTAGMLLGKQLSLLQLQRRRD